MSPLILEHKVTRKQLVCVMYTRHYQALLLEEISCDEYRREMTVNRLTWRELVKEGKEKMKERERQVASGTIQLPSELYWISPPFKIRRQISFNPPLDPRGRITLFFFSRQPRSLYPLPAPFQRALHKTEHCGLYYLSYAFLNIKLNSKKVYYFFFYCVFLQIKKDMRGVCICIMICIILLFCVLYYPSII